MYKQSIITEEKEVQNRLDALDLSTSDLSEIRDIAIGSAAEATDFHPTNSPGLLSYIHGTWALRDKYVGENWARYSQRGIEGIYNTKHNLLIVFQNVDLACDKKRKPKPRSNKGTGSERAFAGNAPTLPFEDLPIQLKDEPLEQSPVAYYLMVDNNGCAELTRPIIKNGTFIDYIERIFLPDSTDVDITSEPTSEADDFVDMDPVVKRKE